MIEPGINKYLLKSQMPESSKCSFSVLPEGFNNLSFCKKRHCGRWTFVSERSQGADALPTEWKYYVLCFLMYSCTWEIQSGGWTTFSFFSKLASGIQVPLRLYQTTSVWFEYYFESSFSFLNWIPTFHLALTMNSARLGWESLPLKIEIFLLDPWFVKFNSLTLTKQLAWWIWVWSLT